MRDERRRSARATGCALLLVVVALLFASCVKDEEPIVPPGGNGTPVGVAQIAGVVRDAEGNPAPNAALHVIYELPALPASTAENPPSVTAFYNEVPLTTMCGGGDPLPDGVMVKLFWDRDGDGPDDEDEPPPLCDLPPACVEGPSGTVNMIEFPINGRENEMGGGLFFTDMALRTVGYTLTPNRYYARIYCADGQVMYTSNVVDAPSGPSEFRLDFVCTPCGGPPAVPSWFFQQSFPNPAADSFVVSFGLRETANAVITRRAVSSRALDTLFSARLSSGGRRIRAAFGNRPNGLYELAMTAGVFSGQHTMLRNITDTDVLRAINGSAISGDDGTFVFPAAAGVILDRRDAQGESAGAVTLGRMRIVALKPGYAAADTVIEAGNGTSHMLTLTLRPQ